MAELANTKLFFFHNQKEQFAARIITEAFKKLGWGKHISLQVFLADGGYQKFILAAPWLTDHPQALAGELIGLIVSYSLMNLFFFVHHERAVMHYGFLKCRAGQQQQAEIFPGR